MDKSVRLFTFEEWVIVQSNLTAKDVVTHLIQYGTGADLKKTDIAANADLQYHLLMLLRRKEKHELIHMVFAFSYC